MLFWVEDTVDDCLALTNSQVIWDHFHRVCYQVFFFTYFHRVYSMNFTWCNIQFSQGRKPLFKNSFSHLPLLNTLSYMLWKSQNCTGLRVNFSSPKATKSVNHSHKKGFTSSSQTTKIEVWSINCLRSDLMTAWIFLNETCFFCHAWWSFWHLMRKHFCFDTKWDVITFPVSFLTNRLLDQ